MTFLVKQSSKVAGFGMEKTHLERLPSVPVGDAVKIFLPTQSKTVLNSQAAQHAWTSTSWPHVAHSQAGPPHHNLKEGHAVADELHKQRGGAADERGHNHAQRAPRPERPGAQQR